MIFVLAVWAVLFLLLAFGMLTTNRKVRAAIDLGDDCSKIVERVDQTRGVQLAGPNRTCVPCVLTRNVPWQDPKEMARIAVFNGSDSVLILDPHGADDIAVSLGKIRVSRFGLFGFAQINLREDKMGSLYSPRYAGTAFVLLFRRDDTNLFAR